jgi:hypothetical protein
MHSKFAAASSCEQLAHVPARSTIDVLPEKSTL